MSLRRTSAAQAPDNGLEIVGQARVGGEALPRHGKARSPQSKKKTADASLTGWAPRTPSSIRAAAAAELHELERTPSFRERLLSRHDPGGILMGGALPGSPARSRPPSNGALPGLPSSPRAIAGTIVPRAKTLSRGSNNKEGGLAPGTRVLPASAAHFARRSISAPDSQAAAHPNGHPEAANPSGQGADSWLNQPQRSTASILEPQRSGHGGLLQEHTRSGTASILETQRSGHSALLQEHTRSGTASILEPQRSGHSGLLLEHARSGSLGGGEHPRREHTPLDSQWSGGSGLLVSGRRTLAPSGFAVPTLDAVRSSSPPHSSESLMNSPKRETPQSISNIHRTAMYHRLAAAGSPRSPSTPTSHAADWGNQLKPRVLALDGVPSGDLAAPSSGGSHSSTGTNSAGASGTGQGQGTGTGTPKVGSNSSTGVSSAGASGTGQGQGTGTGTPKVGSNSSTGVSSAGAGGTGQGQGAGTGTGAPKLGFRPSLRHPQPTPSPEGSRYSSPMPGPRGHTVSEVDSTRTMGRGAQRPGSGTRYTAVQALVDAVRSKDDAVLAKTIEELSGGGSELVGLNDRHPVAGRTALHEAVMLNNTAMVRLLLRAGSNPNVAHDTMGPPLLHAAAWGEAEMLSLLLEAKADILAKDVAGFTALHYACSGGHTEAGRVLLSHGGDLGALNNNGDAPLDLARPDVQRALSSVGSINGVRQHHRSPSSAGGGAGGAPPSSSGGASEGGGAPSLNNSLGRPPPSRPPKSGTKLPKPPSGRDAPGHQRRTSDSRPAPKPSSKSNASIRDVDERDRDAEGASPVDEVPPRTGSPSLPNSTLESDAVDKTSPQRPPKLELPSTIRQRLSKGATLGDIIHSFEQEDAAIAMRASQQHGLGPLLPASAQQFNPAADNPEMVAVGKEKPHAKATLTLTPSPKADASTPKIQFGLSIHPGEAPSPSPSQNHKGVSPSSGRAAPNPPGEDPPPSLGLKFSVGSKDGGFGGLPLPSSNSGSINELVPEPEIPDRPYRSPRQSIDGGGPPAHSSGIRFGVRTPPGAEESTSPPAHSTGIRFGVGPPPRSEENTSSTSPPVYSAGIRFGVRMENDSTTDAPIQRLWQMTGTSDPARISQAASALAAQIGTNKSTDMLLQRAQMMFRQSVDLRTGDLQWTRGELLGEGSFGKVFAGLNQMTGELMAVKVLELVTKSGTCKDNVLAQLEELKSELDLYKTLKHRHVVGYIDAQFDSRTSTLYIFLEYVPGGSIASMLERFGKFSEELVRNYTRQLLLGMEYLHNKKIVHRDVKGGNILVSRDGVVKLADFGASKAYHDQDPMTITDGMKSLKGSVFWMAPEVIKGTGYGRRADVWSLGCTVLEMLSGKHPWPNLENHWSAMFSIAKEEQGPPRPAGVSDLALDFLNKCLQYDPKQRPSATEMLQHNWVAAPEVSRKDAAEVSGGG